MLRFLNVILNKFDMLNKRVDKTIELEKLNQLLSQGDLDETLDGYISIQAKTKDGTLISITECDEYYRLRGYTLSDSGEIHHLTWLSNGTCIDQSGYIQERYNVSEIVDYIKD